MRYASTYIADWHPAWADSTSQVDTSVDLLRAMWTLSRHNGPAILNGAVPARRAYVDLLAAAALQRRGQLVLIAEPTWEPGSRKLDRLLGVRREHDGYDAPPVTRPHLQRALMALIDGPTVHYGVLSRHEVGSLSRAWGIEKERIHFVPFCATRSQDQVGVGGGGVFAGGNSLRDYRALAEAAASIDSLVTIATAIPAQQQSVARVGHMASDEYDSAATAADVVVVPLMAGTTRSAGQQTYLNAMLRGQPVVVTHAPGVEDYVTHGETGLVVDNEPQALAGAINGLLADADLRRRLGVAARRAALERFQLRHYFDRLLNLAAVLSGSVADTDDPSR